MKIMHLADLHLGSQMKKFPKDKAEERRREIRSTFERAVAFARSEGIKIFCFRETSSTATALLKRTRNIFTAW